MKVIWLLTPHIANISLSKFIFTLKILFFILTIQYQQIIQTPLIIIIIMQKLEQFQNQVDKNIREVIQIKRKEEKEKENELLKKLELLGGINNEKIRDQYVIIKFMNFFISQKIQYLEFTKKNNKHKNENDFMKSMQNVIVILSKNQKENTIFTKVSFMKLHDLLDEEFEKLPFYKKNKIIVESYEEILEQTDKLKDLTLNNERFSIVRYGTLKGLSDMETIQKELHVNFY